MKTGQVVRLTRLIELVAEHVRETANTHLTNPDERHIEEIKKTAADLARLSEMLNVFVHPGPKEKILRALFGELQEATQTLFAERLADILLEIA